MALRVAEPIVSVRARSEPIEEFAWAAAPARRKQRSLLRAGPIVAGALIALVLGSPVVAYLAGYHTLVVTSGSMAPEVRPGDAMLVERLPPDTIRAGDVIAFHPLLSSRLTSHRVVAKRRLEDGLYFQTKGDANATADPNLVPASNVFGRVKTTLPSIGRVYAFALTERGRLLLVILPAALIIALEALRFLREPARRPAQVTPLRKRHHPHRWRFAAVAVIVLMAIAAPAGARFTDSAAVAGNTFTSGQVNPPTLSTATAVLCTVTLVWVAPLSGKLPDGYDVYRATSSGGPYTFRQHVALVTTTTDTGAATTTYYYVLQSTLSSWTSGNSNEMSVTTGGPLGC